MMRSTYDVITCYFLVELLVLLFGICHKHTCLGQLKVVYDEQTRVLLLL